MDPSGHMNYFTQTGTLLWGITCGFGDQLKGLLSMFNPATYIDLANGILSGKINLKTILSGMLGDYIYFFKNLWIFNPFKKASNDQVFTVGKSLAGIIVDIASIFVGGGAAIKLLSKTKFGQKIAKNISKINKIIGSNISKISNKIIGKLTVKRFKEFLPK